MYLSTAAYFLATGLALAQFSYAADTAHWCGTWAGAPNPRDVPAGQQLPRSTSTRTLFIEPQLQVKPFSPPIGNEPKVQVPKIWGNNQFRLALLSYSADMPAIRIYASSKSNWAEIHGALQYLMDNCVTKGSGGAVLVPPIPGLTQGTLVLYAYEIGSKFDFQMNYYMTEPHGINPARLSDDMASAMVYLNETDVAIANA